MSQDSSWGNKFFEIIKDQLIDLSYISVVTGTGDTYVTINPGSNNIIKELEDQKVKIVARTYMELDGDITMILPTKNDTTSNEVDQELMKMHRENTETAVENWKTFVNTVMDIAGFVGKLTGIGVSINDTSSRSNTTTSNE